MKPTKNDESELYLEFKIITDTDGTQLLPLVHKKSNDNIVVEEVIEELPVHIHHIQIPKNYDTSSNTIISNYKDIPFGLKLGEYFEKFETVRVYVGKTYSEDMFIMISFVDCEKDVSDINPLESSSFAMRVFATRHYEELKYQLDNNCGWYFSSYHYNNY